MKFGKEYIEFAKNTQGLDFACKGDWQKIYVQMMDRLFSNYKNGKSLDFGCALGANTSAFKDVGYDMIGVDVSEDYINASPFKDVEIKAFDGKKLPYEDGMFNFIHAQQVMEHIPEKILVKNILPELFRVMKEGGIFFMGTPQGCENGIDPGDPTHCSCFLSEKWIKLFTKAGFVNVSDKFSPKWEKEPMFIEYKWLQHVFMKPTNTVEHFANV